MIMQSPDTSSTRATLEGELLELVWAYYVPGQESTDVATAGTAVVTDEGVATALADRAGARDDTSEPVRDTTPRVGEVRDGGDVIDTSIVADEGEVLRRPVVKEVLRVR
jgi:hypothetical protein